MALELDRIAIVDGPTFSAWLYAWKERAIAGERVRVLLADDNSHAIVVADPDAPTPRSLSDWQLELEVDR